MWKIEDNASLVENRLFDLIVPISYSTRRDKLVTATEEIVRRAAELAQGHPEAVVVLSTCGYTFRGAEEIEWTYKQNLFEQYGITARRAGSMNNSVQEADAVAKYVALHRLHSKRILIVTGEMHSRSARWIWRQVMPDSKISTVCISSRYEWQPDHPVLVQRGPWRWFAANIARQILLRILGLDRTGRLHHRSEK